MPGPLTGAEATACLICLSSSLALELRLNLEKKLLRLDCFAGESAAEEVAVSLAGDSSSM